MNPSDQPARQENIDAIVSFYRSGIKSVSKSQVGIELEHTLVTEANDPVAYSDGTGTAWLLEQLAREYPAVTRDDAGDILGVMRRGEAVTIEPAAQLELSAGPFEHLSDAEDCFVKFENLVAGYLIPENTKVLTIGYNPVAKAADLELIPKRRYELMNAYLGAISKFGICMMRGSAATQVAIDYTSEEDCLHKLRIAYALVPLFSLICDNSPIFEDEPRRHQLVRTEIWERCDPERCGTVPGVMDPGFTLADYAAYILDTPAILVPCDCEGHEGWCADNRTFGEIYADKPMTRAEVEHALSMFFTDVRLKTYIEIRPADAMPIPYVIAYAALIKGLFYGEGSLDELDGLFGDVDALAIDDAKDALMAEGYGATVYGRPVGELCDAIMTIADDGLADDEAGYLAPLATLVRSRTTLADIMAEQNGNLR